jgi:hypothetical protein
VNTQQAQSAVSLSAFVVAVIFAYRKLTETATSSKNTPSTAHFVIGFGFVYITLSLAAQAAPAFGGMMAILVATGDALANGGPVINDLTGSLKRTSLATASVSSNTASGSSSAQQQANALANASTIVTPGQVSAITVNPPPGVTLTLGPTSTAGYGLVP